ncbi:hypothetical protein Sme01_05610 [Sphaerisporangium melleum]|uniref:DUF4276 family protein n=1 Tax=Sphaerisporangium melleum TaxID=321316 RepID=A0A917VCQ5_9ACTN|nr:DUF4276 family protein [Sphaerisporangium melleum]GGK63442.1 hypothetical protein GCM10007964_03180 [Sphaerisporangium melleum]GII68085.1 hypothetical protein Sme01_05610 [Sphaerisporangium melleum]
MRRLHVLCEGQTEETVVREVLAPYFENAGAFVTCSIHKTRRPAGGPAQRGGLSGWNRIETEIRLLLRDSSITVLTTLFDYYGLPSDVPGMETRPAGSPYDRVTHVERAMAEAIGDSRFVPHLVLHEIEAWVLVGHAALGDLTGDAVLARDAQEIVSRAQGAEFVNDGFDTAPSKRIISLYPRYRKPPTARSSYRRSAWT